MAFKATRNMPFSLVLQKLSSFQASSEIFNIVLFMVSYILITGYSILLFMNPLNFKFQLYDPSSAYSSILHINHRSISVMLF